VGNDPIVAMQVFYDVKTVVVQKFEEVVEG